MICPSTICWPSGSPTEPASWTATPPGEGPAVPGAWVPPAIESAGEPDDEEEDLGDEEDLAVSQPLADEDSAFDDFDDEFDDDFEEEPNDPDWDHPDDAEPEEPPTKGPGRKK